MKRGGKRYVKDWNLLSLSAFSLSTRSVFQLNYTFSGISHLQFCIFCFLHNFVWILVNFTDASLHVFFLLLPFAGSWIFRFFQFEFLNLPILSPATFLILYTVNCYFFSKNLKFWLFSWLFLDFPTTFFLLLLSTNNDANSANSNSAISLFFAFFSSACGEIFVHFPIPHSICHCHPANCAIPPIWLRERLKYENFYWSL